MTQDLLKLAEECESIATEPDVDTQIYELTTTGAEMLARSTIALREAHAEICRLKRNKEFDSMSIDMINEETGKIIDCLSKRISKIKSQNDILRDELDAANALIKRHDEALESVFDSSLYIPYLGNSVEFLSSLDGTQYIVSLCGICAEVNNGETSREFIAASPLAAIEAAQENNL